MGILSTFIPFLVVYVTLKLEPSRTSLLAGSFVGAYLGDVAAAVAAGLELGLSYPLFPYSVVISVAAMAIHHSVIGVIEDVATMLILMVLMRVRPDLLSLEVAAPIVADKLPPLMEGK